MTHAWLARGVASGLVALLAAVTWAQESEDGTEVLLLIERLADPDGGVRGEACRDLAAAWPRASRAVPSLCIVAEDDAPPAVRAADGQTRRHPTVRLDENGVSELPWLAPGRYEIEVEGWTRTFSVPETTEVRP